MFGRFLLFNLVFKILGGNCYSLCCLESRDVFCCLRVFWGGLGCGCGSVFFLYNVVFPFSSSLRLFNLSSPFYSKHHYHSCQEPSWIDFPVHLPQILYEKSSDSINHLLIDHSDLTTEVGLPELTVIHLPISFLAFLCFLYFPCFQDSVQDLPNHYLKLFSFFYTLTNALMISSFSFDFKLSLSLAIASLILLILLDI